MSVSVRLRREISVTINVSFFFKTAQQAAELAVSLALLATDDFRHPMIDNKLSAFGEAPDLILLVGKMLFSRADA